MMRYRDKFRAAVEMQILDGAMGAWPLDDPPGSTVVRDASGNNLKGTITYGACGWDGPCGVGRSIHLVAASSPAIDVPIAPIPTVGTLEAWARLTTAPNWDGPFGLFDHSNAAGGARTILRYYNGGGVNGQIQGYSDGKSYLWTPGVTILRAGVWLHIVMTYQKSPEMMRLFVNGIEQPLVGSSGTWGTTARGASSDIGSYGSGGSFTGDLALAAMYPIVLEPQRVLSHYAAIAEPYVLPVVRGYGAGVPWVYAYRAMRGAA
jgi:hypothetical protein